LSARRLSKINYLAGGLVLAAGAGAGITALVLAPGSAATGSVGTCSGRPTVTATGSGMANGTPDLLTMQIGVQTSASSASAALAANNNKAQSLLTSLERGGVKASDIQTSNLSINPTYDNAGTITGYQAEDDLTVQVHQISSAGSLIDTAASKLGNDVRFNGLAFSVSDPSGPSAAARADAVRVAVAEARGMAVAAGSSLGTLCSISDTGSASPPPIEGYPLHASGVAANALTPIQPGNQQFSAQVTVEYQLG
jgi:uncharacterized protein YggE